MKSIFGLLGHPVGHSMSPLIHNDAFISLGMEAEYHAFDVTPELLKEAVAGIRALGIIGCNVTVPHKVAVMKYLDEIDEQAQLIGAVNTIVNDNGRLIGYNTDGKGYVESLLELEPVLSEKRVLIIGAGGAARGIVTALLGRGIASLTITNRTIEKAKPFKKLAETFDTRTVLMTREEAESKAKEFDVIINTTSVGMSPHIEQSPFSLENISDHVVVSDLIYNPIETALLKDARKRGAKTLNGVGMFVNQAALSFEQWTGQKPNREKMKQLVLKQLGGKTC
ncbi:shikimate dehydrogenase [Alkalihalobacillus hemicellulosilyticus]|uniref:Shikimate dehydrogenase (NADP(+)) n=1 Tax=Halalkalibacter hemicellulosilyticusJCM 9152 TaxID=1236971 RepID=W4QJ48_9BACI|nr:shikimate dehydrogenase [Halalkalibacter hemicellulosilyticus]GAE31668.1 shikimate 5-dehydrogenase I alpha [Halalkalibacter hemicellulosilyticusJCM 9152]